MTEPPTPSPMQLIDAYLAEIAAVHDKANELLDAMTDAWEAAEDAMLVTSASPHVLATLHGELDRWIAALPPDPRED